MSIISSLIVKAATKPGKEETVHRPCRLACCPLQRPVLSGGSAQGPGSESLGYFGARKCSGLGVRELGTGALPAYVLLCLQHWEWSLAYSGCSISIDGLPYTALQPNYFVLSGKFFHPLDLYYLKLDWTKWFIHSFISTVINFSHSLHKCLLCARLRVSFLNRIQNVCLLEDSCLQLPQVPVVTSSHFHQRQGPWRFGVASDGPFS